MTGKTTSRIKKAFSEAILGHQMLEEGDHVVVGLSGGKDSWALAGLLVELQKKAPISFRVSALTIDGGLEGLDTSAFEEACKAMDIPFHLVRQSIFQTVSEKKEEGSTFCSMCAKLRRGAIYTAAEKMGATKIALGHHFDDALETLFLNLFYGGRLAALPPVLISDSGHPPIIRPLLYIFEQDVADYAKERGFPMIGCACPICPTHPDHEYSDLKRKQVKAWITKMSAEIPSLRESARSAMKNVKLDRFFGKELNIQGKRIGD